MTIMLTTRRWQCAVLGLAVAWLLAVSPLIADAALAPISETIISRNQMAGVPTARTEMRSTLTFAAPSSWRTDPDHEVVTLVVTQGVLEVHLAEGTARIDRDAMWLAATRREPLVPGTPTTLFVGDRLVVVRGYLLTVTNRTDASATGLMHRVQLQ